MLRNLLIILVVLLSSIFLSLYAFKPGLTYDGGLYAALGYSLYEKRSYEFNQEPGEVPPFFPILLALSFFLFGENGMYLVSPLMSVVLLLTVFFILERKFKQSYAFLGALLFLSTKMIFTYSVYVLRDITLLAFTMLSYLIYEKSRLAKRSETKLHSQAGAQNLMLCSLGISIALAFLTKYVAAVYLLPIFLEAIYRRKKWMKYSVATAFFIITPWAAWSMVNHDTPLIEHSTRHLAELNPEGFYEKALLYFKSWFFSPIILFSLLGVFLKIWREKLKIFTDLYFLLFIFTFLSAFVWPIKSDRYLLASAFPVVYFALHFLSSLEFRLKNAAALLLVIGIVFQVNASIVHLEEASQKYTLLKDAGHWLRDNAPENAEIMTSSFRQIAFFSHRRTYEAPLNESAAVNLIEEKSISHIVIDSYEAMTPSYIYFLAERYELAWSLKDNYGEVKIYNLEKWSR